MSGTKLPLMGSVTLILAGIGLALFVTRARQSDAEFAQRVMRELINGHSSAQRHIGWERLQALEMPVGNTYVGLASDQERGRYRDTFIRAFAEGFRKTGADADSLVNWRVAEHGRNYTVVSAYYPAKHRTLLMRIARDGRRQVVGFQWQ